MLRIVEYYFLYSSNLKCFSRQNKKKQKQKNKTKTKTKQKNTKNTSPPPTLIM